MPNNAYSGYYYQPNRNIIVVPTVSFSPPHTGTKHIADPKTSSPTSPTLNCEQITPGKGNIGEPCALLCGSNCNQQDLPVVSSNTSTSTKFSDNFKNSLCVIHDKISTDTPAFDKSQSIQDLSTPTPKYKPRHNLVDLTGFNIPKREKLRDSTSSLLKHKDLRQIDEPKTEQDKMKTSYDENEHRDYSDSDNYKIDNISKESSTNAKPTSTYSERNTENLTCGEPKTNKTDMKDKMKIYYKQLWKRSFEKIKAAKEKYVRDIKGCNKTTQEYKDTKESSRGKAYLQKVSKSNSTKDLRNKIAESSQSKANLQNVSNSNSTKDLRNKIIERKFMVKYTKRSKSETNSRHLPDSKLSIRNRRIDLSPDSLRRYIDFQHFKRHSDYHEIKYKSRNQIKTENLPRKKIRMKSCETTTNNPVSKNNVDERKKSIISEKRSKVNTNQTNLEKVENYTDMKRAIDQNNTDRVKLIKSVVRVDKNFHNNLSQRKRVRSPDGVEDLRLRLSRKRARSKYLGHYHEPMENRLVQESPMITVNRDMQADSKNSPILAPTVNKPKLNKCKKIKLFINIVCPISDSVNSDQDLNESCSSPEDFSFLEDFNIDEIVDSLNISQVEPNKTITTDHNDQTKHKEGPINDVGIKATEITKKEETSSHKEQVIEISLDTVDGNMNIEIGSIANTKKCKDEQNTDENSKVVRNTKQEANNITDLTGKGFEESDPKETVDLCKDELSIKTNSKVHRNTKQELNYITDLTGKGYEESTPKEIVDLCKDDYNIKTNSKIVRNTKQEPNYITDLTGKGFEESAPKETNSKIERNTKQKANNKTDLNRKYCDKNAAKETTNLSDDDSVVEVIDISDENGHYTISKHLVPIKPIQTSTLAKKANLAKSKFQYKPSVNNTKYEDKTNITAKQKIDPTNITDKKQTACLQTMFNIEQKKTINSIGQLNTLDRQVTGKNVNSHNSEDTVEASLETMFNNCEQNGSVRKHIKQNKINTCDENVKENSIQESVDVVSLETTLFNSTKHQDTDINMDIEQPSSGQHIQKEIDVLQTAQVMTKLPLETMSNIVDQNKNLNEIKIAHVTDKYTKIESETRRPGTQILSETTKNDIEQNDDIKINSEPINVIKENRSLKSGSISKNSLETEENILEKANNKIYSPQSKNKLLFDSGKSTKGNLETAKMFAENCPSSSQVDIRPQSSLGQNNKPKSELLQKSVETIKTSKTTIDNVEQKINIRSESNKSDKNIEEKTLLTSQNSEVKSKKSPERSNIQHKTNVTTSVELTNADKNIEVTSRKTSIVRAENSLTANNKETTLRATKKSNVENQTTSETVKNNTQKLETIDDACDLNKITIKDSELGKRSEISTKQTETKQEQVVSNKSLFPNGSKNKDAIKSNKQAEIFTPPVQNFLSKLELQMSEYLQNKYTFSSVIHNGRFSKIYKCFDTKGRPYAVKVVNQLKSGMFMEGMLFGLQHYRPKQDSFVLYLISALEVENKWCLLTEYYAVNLKQALHGNAHGFHINRVQVLSKQLVDAVKMLTNAGVIHSDIKPSHILLNRAHDRLKLCGFDRSNYRSCIKITPSTGTPIYRAPEVILGFQEDHRIDLWSTALVMFQMATNKTLFTGGSNNAILYQQLCTFGSFGYSMVEQSRFGALHFYGSSFLQKIRYKNYEETRVIYSLQRNDNLRRILFQSYEGQRARYRSKWQMWNAMHKFELLYTLLEQMLVMDPRNRLPIQFVGASEFMNN